MQNDLMELYVPDIYITAVCGKRSPAAGQPSGAGIPICGVVMGCRALGHSTQNDEQHTAVEQRENYSLRSTYSSAYSSILETSVVVRDEVTFCALSSLRCACRRALLRYVRGCRLFT